MIVIDNAPPLVGAVPTTGGGDAARDITDEAFELVAEWECVCERVDTSGRDAVDRGPDD